MVHTKLISAHIVPLELSVGEHLVPFSSAVLDDHTPDPSDGPSIINYRTVIDTPLSSVPLVSVPGSEPLDHGHYKLS